MNIDGVCVLEQCWVTAKSLSFPTEVRDKSSLKRNRVGCEVRNSGKVWTRH